MAELDGKVALITGGSKGIGRAIALSFAEDGADIALAARGAEALEKTAREIEERGRRAIAVPTDVTDADQAKTLVDRTVAELGGIDILVNNAGAAPFLSTFDQVRMSGFEKYFGITFMGSVYVTHAAAPILLEKGTGSVINVASVAAYVASPGLTYYAAAKGAMVNFTKTLAREWAPHGVRVNAIAPGFVETDMNIGAREDPSYYETIRSMIPLGRWGTPEDVAGVARFLASDAARFMTGSVVVVDGGQTLNVLMGQ
ncbi:MAG TPA: SDR family NAD(P)-dependent oxidoreductase [Actinomycetota bacterium]|nr:SDR family NAD(P)-dependent oxidoreductase [Actinomycetota bacterium]